MKVFKFKFTKPTYAMIFAGLALAAAAFAVNTYFVVAEGFTAAKIVYNILQYTVTYFVAALLAIVLVSLLISSYYAVDDKYMKTSFGIIKSKYELAKISTIELDRNTNKLAVFFKDESFVVIAVKPEWYEDFVNAILAANRSVIYNITSKTEDSENKKK